MFTIHQKIFIVVLGVINKNIYLASNFYIPRRMIDKFERFIRATMQGDLKGFYQSNAYHLDQFRKESNSTYSEKTSDDGIGMKDLRLIFFTYVSLNLLAALSFVVELAWFHFEKRRQQ